MLVQVAIIIPDGQMLIGETMPNGKKERHPDLMWRALPFLDIESYDGTELQGFIDENGKFFNRRNAVIEAIKCGQIVKPKWPPDLYSEDLW